MIMESGAQRPSLHRRKRGACPAPWRDAPMTAYQLLGRMQRNGGAVAPPTVYRALRGLEEAGVVQRIETLRAWAVVLRPCGGVAICGRLRVRAQRRSAEPVLKVSISASPPGLCRGPSHRCMAVAVTAPGGRLKDLLLSGVVLRLALRLASLHPVGLASGWWSADMASAYPL